MGSDSSLDQIKKPILSRELSGLSKSAFCCEHQMSYHKVNYWHKRIGAPVRTAAAFVPEEVINPRTALSERITVRSKSGMEVSFPMHKESIALIRQLHQ